MDCPALISAERRDLEQLSIRPHQSSVKGCSFRGSNVLCACPEVAKGGSGEWIWAEPFRTCYSYFSFDCQLRARSLAVILHTLYQFPPTSLSLTQSCSGSVGALPSCLIFLKALRFSSEDALSPQFPKDSLDIESLVTSSCNLWY